MSNGRYDTRSKSELRYDNDEPHSTRRRKVVVPIPEIKDWKVTLSGLSDTVRDFRDLANSLLLTHDRGSGITTPVFNRDVSNALEEVEELAESFGIVFTEKGQQVARGNFVEYEEVFINPITRKPMCIKYSHGVGDNDDPYSLILIKPFGLEETPDNPVWLVFSINKDSLRQTWKSVHWSRNITQPRIAKDEAYIAELDGFLESIITTIDRSLENE